jgi:hypothetical protein
VGSHLFGSGQSAEGAAFVYYGSASGRPVLASQFRGDASAAVASWGLSHQADGFVVSMQATSPRGRERAKLQVEACPSGAAFGSLVCDIRTSSAWTELGANPQAVTMALPVNGLSAQQVYHWRARVLYAPLTVTAAGVNAAPNPMAGPWRRLHSTATTADIRTDVPPTLQVFADGFE